MSGKRRRLVSKQRRASKNLSLAGKNVKQGAALALAANAVISRRTAKAIAGIADPVSADHGEFGRLVPEKVHAFTVAGMEWAHYAFAAGARCNVLALNECAALGRTALALADVSNSLLAFWGRLEWAALKASADALAAQRAITSPILATAKANAARLRRD
jgi:hypothetical protein